MSGEPEDVFMIQIRDKETRGPLGTITEEQLMFLIENLEEEHVGDQDYYISAPTLDVFEQRGIDAGVLELLRKALATKEGVEIEWSRV